VARRPRVVMVSANAFPVMGGVETHLHEVAPRVAAAGFDVTMLTTDRSGKLPEHESLNGVPAIRVPARPRSRDWYVAPSIAREIWRGDYDLVHCQGYHTFVPPIAMLAARRARIPYVLTFHSGGHPSSTRTRLRGPQRRFMRPLLARARKLIAVSEFEVEFFSRELSLPRSRFVKIQNGAAMPVPSRPVPIDPDRPVIVSAGRLERYKGHHRLIEALPFLLREVPGARLRIVGAGQFETELRRMAAAAPPEVAERIEIGSVDPKDRDGMSTVLASASLVTLLSEYEANPVAVMEALALGRRVLVAETSGLTELAAAGMARGISINATAEEIARAIAEELQTPEPAELKLASWDDCAAQLADVYRAVLAR
jgi:glycosyltransferase involved in cell wall biosynthesis